jgi:hypothetical protein
MLRQRTPLTAQWTSSPTCLLTGEEKGEDEDEICERAESSSHCQQRQWPFQVATARGAIRFGCHVNANVLWPQ